jgi:O-antigen/teichoic acid export membrane protein
MSRPRGVLLNSLSQAGVRLLGSATALLLTWLIARRSVDDLGVFRTVFVYFLATEFIPLLGMQTYLIREIAVRPDQARRLTLHSGIFAGVISVLAALLLVGVSFFGGYSQDISSGLLIVAGGMPATGGALVALSVLVGAGRATQFSVMQGTETLIRTVAGMACILAGWSVLAVVAVIVATRWVILIGYWRHLRPLLGAGLWVFDKSFFRTFLATVPTFAGITVLSIVTRFAAQAVLPWMLDDAAAGQFAAAYIFIDLALLIPTAITTNLVPVLARTAQVSASALGASCQQGLKLMISGVLPISAILAAIAPPMIATVLPGNASYTVSAQVLQVVIWICSLQAMDQVLASAIVARGRQDVDLHTVAVGAAALVILLLALVPVYGVHGAAYAVLGGMVISLSVRIFLVARHVPGIRIHEAIWRALIAGAAAVGVAAWLSKTHWIAAALVGGVTYLAVLALTGGFARQQRQGIFQLLQAGRA